MIEIIGLIALCFGFSIMSYDSFKKGSKLFGCLALGVVIANLLDILTKTGLLEFTITIVGGN